MTIKVIDEASSNVRSLTGAMRDLKAAGEDVNATGATGAARADAWEAEASAVKGVAVEVRALGSMRQNTGSITAATHAYREEAAAVEHVAATASKAGDRMVSSVHRQREAERAAFQASKAEEAEAARAMATHAATPPILPAEGPTFAGMNRPRMTEQPDLGAEAGRNRDWGAYWAAKREAEPEAHPRATDWAAQQEALRGVEEQAARATDRMEELEERMGRLGMAGMAFGQVRGFGEAIRKPVEAADDLYTEFQRVTQDLATRSENNGGQQAIGDHILKVARDANVPWRQVYEGEQALASLGGGKELSAMAAYETRMNKLALAGHVEANDVYSAMMHYIKGGLSAAEAMDALEQQHVQGKRGSVELNNLARVMPSLMALGKSFGMTPKQATTDVSGLMQIMRENVGTSFEAETLTRHLMTKLGDPRTVKRLESDLDIDGFAVRATAKAKGENPLIALLDAVADKFATLSPEQKGSAVSDGQGHGSVQGGDPKVMGDLARDYYFRAGLDAYIQHRKELPEFNVPIDEARRTTDEDYAAQNSTVAQAKQVAENAKAAAAIAAGQTQVGVMKAEAGAKGGAFDVGGWFASHMPGVTGVVGAATDIGGGALSALGRLGEAAIAAATGVAALKWVGARYPAMGEAAGAVGDAARGFAQGVSEGARQAMAEAGRATATGGPDTGAAAGGAAEGLGSMTAAAESAASRFAAVSTDLGTIGMLAAWASQPDRGVGLRHPLTPEQMAYNPLHIDLGPPPAEPAGSAATATRAAADGVAAALQPLTEALREQARRSADDFRRDPEAARGRAMMAAGSEAPAGPALSPSTIQSIVAPVEAGVQGAIARATAALVPAVPRPTAAEAAPQQVTNNNQRTVNAPITVNAPVTISATMTNTTPAAVGAAVGRAIHGGVRAGAGALHDGTETK